MSKDQWVAAAYSAGWNFTNKLPQPIASAMFDMGADVVSRWGHKPDQLRRNLEHVVPGGVDRALMKKSMRSYMRYWREAFQLPSLAGPQLAESLDDSVQGKETLHASVEAGKGVILSLPHSGNWDMAGMWLVQRYGQFTTVAERLKPESLFNEFVSFRESLGFDVIPLTGSERPPFEYLSEVLQQGGIVCLLGERDLGRHGVEVEFFGETCKMPAGSAKLAQDTGAALHIVHTWFELQGWGFSVSDPVDTSGTISDVVSRQATLYQDNIAQHPEDWHMLQPLWKSDWRVKE